MLSELLADLDACDLHKGEANVLANGEVAPGESVVCIYAFKQRKVFRPTFCEYVSVNSFFASFLSGSSADKKTAIKNRIKQMMDVSRVRFKNFTHIWQMFWFVPL